MPNQVLGCNLVPVPASKKWTYSDYLTGLTPGQQYNWNRTGFDSFTCGNTTVSSSSDTGGTGRAGSDGRLQVTGEIKDNAAQNCNDAHVVQIAFGYQAATQTKCCYAAGVITGTGIALGVTALLVSNPMLLWFGALLLALGLTLTFVCKCHK